METEGELPGGVHDRHHTGGAGRRAGLGLHVVNERAVALDGPGVGRKVGAFDIGNERRGVAELRTGRGQLLPLREDAPVLGATVQGEATVVLSPAVDTAPEPLVKNTRSWVLTRS